MCRVFLFSNDHRQTRLEKKHTGRVQRFFAVVLIGSYYTSFTGQHVPGISIRSFKLLSSGKEQTHSQVLYRYSNSMSDTQTDTQATLISQHILVIL